MASTQGPFDTYPGVYVYVAADGHKREAHPHQFKNGKWDYIWSFAGCANDCAACGSGEQDDYAGERWDDE